VNDCLFCKISSKAISSKILYEDADIFAFEDIAPQAPTHILICPRQHWETLADAKAEDAAQLGRLFQVAAKLAAEKGIIGGYRTVVNNGLGAGQSVSHLHVHLLGGRTLRWPPG
jgi:histidine triad (HIT) family protein